MKDKYNSPNKTLSFILAFLLFTNFAILGIKGVNTEVNPQAWDTTAYLGEANFIKNSGGLSNFLNLCFSGNYIQANQHPLFILLLVPFASTDISFFIFAKLVNFLIGFVCLLVIYFCSKKVSGNINAAIVVCALTFNVIFIRWTTLVACESLLMLFSFLTIFFIQRGFEKNTNWIYAGAFAGFAYLTKGTSIILLPGFVVAGIFVYKFKLLKNKFFWSFFLLFFLVSSPLLIRNVIVYKNPFFNVNNYIITLGIDYLDEYRHVTYSPNEGASLWKFDEVKKSNLVKNSDSNLLTKLPILAEKVYDGLKLEAKIFLNSFNVFQNFLSKPVLWISVTVLMLFFVIGIWLERDKGKRTYLIAVLIVYLLFIIFNPIDRHVLPLTLLLFFVLGIGREKSKGGKVYLLTTIMIFLLFISFNPIDRYFLPLTASIWIYIGIGIISIGESLYKKYFNGEQKIDYKIYMQLALLILLITHLSYSVIKEPLSNPMKSVYSSKSRTDILNWLKANLKTDEKYTLGPNFNWQLSTGNWVLPPFNARTKDYIKFNEFIERHKIAYIIIDTETIPDKMELIKNHFEIDPVEGLIQKMSEPQWELVCKDKNKPIDYMIFKVKHRTPS